jgi:hypothetical protein
MSLRAAILSSSEGKVVVVRGGMSARGSLVWVRSESADVMVASEEGCSGGSVPDDDGSRRGVEEVEFSVEGGRTRFARRNEKKAEEY